MLNFVGQPFLFVTIYLHGSFNVFYAFRLHWNSSAILSILQMLPAAKMLMITSRKIQSYLVR
jgi:hypothetical protein